MALDGFEYPESRSLTKQFIVGHQLGMGDSMITNAKLLIAVIVQLCVLPFNWSDVQHAASRPGTGHTDRVIGTKVRLN